MRHLIETIVGTIKANLNLLFVLPLLALSLGCQSKIERAPEMLAPEVKAKTGVITTTLVSNPPEPYTNSTSIIFDFTSNAPDAKFICAFQNGDGYFCVPPIKFANLIDGSYVFFVYAVSATMGTDMVGAKHHWDVDTVPPKTTLAATVTGGDSILFALSANEPACDFVCSYDGSVPQPCTSPVAWKGVTVGRHIFKAYAVDAAKNVDPVGAEYNFELETPLTTTILSATPSAAYVNQNSIAFAFTSNHPDATYLCTLDAGAPVPCVSPFTYQSLRDGYYKFHVQAVDSVGRIDPVGATYMWIVDTTAPVGTIAKVDATSTSLTVTWTTDEPTTTKLYWGRDKDLSRQTAEDLTMTTTHVARISGLSSNTPFSLQPAGSDRATNAYRVPSVVYRTMR